MQLAAASATNVHNVVAYVYGHRPQHSTRAERRTILLKHTVHPSVALPGCCLPLQDIHTTMDLVMVSLLPFHLVTKPQQTAEWSGLYSSSSTAGSLNEAILPRIL